MKVAESRRPTAMNATVPAVQAMCRARSIRAAPIAMPIIGTEAMPNENDIERQAGIPAARRRYRSRRGFSVPNFASNVGENADGSVPTAMAKSRRWPRP